MFQLKFVFDNFALTKGQTLNAFVYEFLQRINDTIENNIKEIREINAHVQQQEKSDVGSLYKSQLSDSIDNNLLRELFKWGKDFRTRTHFRDSRLEELLKTLKAEEPIVMHRSASHQLTRSVVNHFHVNYDQAVLGDPPAPKTGLQRISISSEDVKEIKDLLGCGRKPVKRYLVSVEPALFSRFVPLPRLLGAYWYNEHRKHSSI